MRGFFPLPLPLHCVQGQGKGQNDGSVWKQDRRGVGEMGFFLFPFTAFGVGMTAMSRIAGSLRPRTSDTASVPGSLRKLWIRPRVPR